MIDSYVRTKVEIYFVFPSVLPNQFSLHILEGPQTLLVCYIYTFKTYSLLPDYNVMLINGIESMLPLGCNQKLSFKKSILLKFTYYAHFLGGRGRSDKSDHTLVIEF